MQVSELPEVVSVSAAGGTGSSSSSNSSSPPKRSRGRPPKQAAAPTKPSAASRAAGASSSAARALHAATGLPLTTAQRVVTAAQRAGSGVPQDAEELQQRLLLQRLLGEDGAARAVQRWPGILGSRPELLALHLQQWLFFFGDDDSSSSSSSSSRPGLRARLAASPQLLAVDAERLVGNLYELGAMVQAEPKYKVYGEQHHISRPTKVVVGAGAGAAALMMVQAMLDLDKFARKALQLALARPGASQEKMRRLLLLLNSDSQRAAEAAGAAAAAAAGGGPAAAAARRRTASLVAPEFSLAQLQAAARRDHRWLALSSDALEARLAGLQQALGPAILHKRSSLLQQRVAALQALPGLGRQRAVAVAVAFPALLNLQPAVLQDRWRLLQQQRYSRLQQVASSRQQARRTMRGLLRMSDEAFQAFADKHLQQPPAAAAAAGALLAGGLAAGKGPLSILQMQLIADGLVVAPAKITINPIVDAGSSSTAAAASAAFGCDVAKQMCHCATGT
ncbi:hypothetical protein COO60DRAFT_1697511 [Scenedesmus sp. NREL 46B-D3]|nr:hypothetical protein COO60DRAFT_1697511 [Scenedesmus sp. NREL 46B-D3]